MPDDSTWTIEAELMGLASVDDLTAACRKLGAISAFDTLCEIRLQRDWYRSGSETYIYEFSVVGVSGEVRDLICKACVAFAPDTTVGAIADQWFTRREALARYVSTPSLLGRAGATWIEERIPLTLREAVGPAASPEVISSVLAQVADYAAALSALGFAAVDAFSDLRSRGNDVVAVDFGEDLGPPGVRQLSADYLSDAQSFLRDAGLAVTDEQRRQMYARFEATERAVTITRDSRR
jgi:hypothetical protein